MKPRSLLHTILAAVAGFALALPAWGGNVKLRPQSMNLPGPPAAVLSADVDGDGARDLVVLALSTAWDQIGVEESSHLDAVLGLVEVLTIVPALLEHREIEVFRGRGDGTFESSATALPVDNTLLSLAVVPPGAAIVALTDSGVSRLQMSSPPTGPVLALVPILEDTPILHGSGNYVPDLLTVRDLDGDHLPDLLFPTPTGVAVYLGDGKTFAAHPASRIELPLDDPKDSDGRLQRHYPLPVVRDVDGDGRPDLLIPHPRRDWNELQVWRGLGGGRFAAPVSPLPARPANAKEANPSVVYFGDVDGDGRAEYVFQESFAPGNDASMRESLHHAKEPPFAYRLLRTQDDLAPAAQPYREFRATGYSFEGSGDVHLPGGMRDLNGDGRLDLVAMTLDFSLFQAVRVLTTKRIGIGLDFHIYCQQPGGAFREVPNLDLSGKFTLDLNDLRIGNLAQFAGDFDGDGVIDFLQIGRGKRAEIHLGRRDCSYPRQPDAEIDLREAAADLGLLRVEDYNGDGKADLLLIQPQEAAPGADVKGSEGASSPVRLDLYLSGKP